MKRKDHTPRDPWVPLVQCNTFTPASIEATILVAMKKYKVDRPTAIELIEKMEVGATYWRNNLYQVQKRECENQLIHLNIRRVDGAIPRDWRHLQRIKNELVGPECEGVELYPAESRLVDTSNKFHIWCVANPAFRFPFGFRDRDIMELDPNHNQGGLRQRPFEGGAPADAKR